MAFDSTYTDFNGRQFNAGTTANPSAIDFGVSGAQLVNFYYQRKALIDLKRDMFFGQLADTTTMP